MKSATGLGIPGFETITVLDDARDTALRARNTRTGDEVVIKLLDRAKEPILPKRFDRSRRSLLNLSNRRIGLVPLLGNGVANDGRDYIIAPYYNLGSLQDQIAAGPTPWHLAAKILDEIARIVGTIHAEGLSLHDIRPSNIFLEAVGEPAVAAFGVATRRFDDGGPVFSAPESTAIEPEFSAASDVYSLALVFGALIAGRPRSRSESNDEFLTELRSLAPERILNVIEHGLAESPTNRYRDAETMQRAIRSAIEADPDAPLPVDNDEPFDLEEIFQGLDDPPPPSPASAGFDNGSLENMPPGLEDITFVSADGLEKQGLNGHRRAVEDPRLELPSDLSDLTLARNPNNHDAAAEDFDDDPILGDAVPGDAVLDDAVLDDRSAEEFAAEEPAPGEPILDLRDLELGSAVDTNNFDSAGGFLPEDLQEALGANGTNGDTARVEDETDDLDDELLDLIGLEAEHLDGGDDRPGGGPISNRHPGPSGASLGTLIHGIDLQMEQISNGSEISKELIPAEASLEDQTSVLRFDQLSQDGEDQTSVLNLDDLREAATEAPHDEDQTGVLSLDELARYEETEDQTSVLNLDALRAADGDAAPDAEDQTSVLNLDDLNQELEDTSDHTSVLDLDEFDEASQAEDRTSVLLLDDIAGYDEADDLTGVLEFDDLEETAIVDLDELAAIDKELGHGISEAGFVGDRTDIFGEQPETLDLPSDHDDGLPGAAPFAAAVAFEELGSSEEIPFQSVDRGRVVQEHSTWPHRARVALEVAWFRSRRALATTAALLGLVAIGAVVVYFLAQEVRTSSKIEAEGIHQASSTTVADSPTTFVATNVPYAVDRPARRTTTTLAAVRSVETTLADSADDETADVNGQSPDTPGGQVPPEVEQPPPSEILPPTSVDEPTPPTTVEEIPPAPGTLAPPPPEQPDNTVAPPTTKKKDRRTTTTEAPPTPPQPTTPPTEPPDDGDDDDDDDPVAAPPPSASLSVGTVGRKAARIRVNSNQCVATRFVLSGSDGSGQEGSTSSFDPSVSCSNGWNLNFTGSSGLEPGTTYTLTVWVKAVETELTSNTSVSFTTAV